MPRPRSMLESIHPNMLPQVHAQLAAQRSPIAVSAGVPLQIEAAPHQRRVRQSRQTMNKLELAYADILRGEFRGERVLAQKVRLWLANGDWYKADFFVPSRQLFIEVKGPHSFRGGFEFLKVAAAQHDWAKFRLVWKHKGQWMHQTILPSEVSA